MDRFKQSPHYMAKEKRFKNPPLEKNFNKLSFFGSLIAIRQLFLDKHDRNPTQKLDEVHPDLEDFLSASSFLKFIWIGHSTLLFNLDGKILLVDPVFSDYAFSLDVFVKRFQDPVLTLKDLPPIDAIVISHDHYDHLDKKTIDFFKKLKTRFILPLGLKAVLHRWGIENDRMVELDWEESVEEFGIKFTAEPAQHFSGRGFFDKNKTLWVSWVIEGQSQKIFYSGDSGYSSHFKKIGDKHGPFDVTFIENGQYDEKWADIHMMPEETIQAHLDLKGKFFVPVHWGMFDLSLHHWRDPVERTYKLATEKKIEFVSPMLGEIIHLDNLKIQHPWWKKNTL